MDYGLLTNNKICKHFGSCGGCSFQDIPYQEQLARKEEKVKQLMALNGITCELKPINSFGEWFYRNKMEFSFGLGSNLSCGFYKKGSHSELVDVEECLIFSQSAGDILKAAKEFLKANGYSTYNKFSYKGFLRNLIIRETKFTPLEKTNNTTDVNSLTLSVHPDNNFRNSPNDKVKKDSLTGLTKEIMVGLVTTSQEALDKEAFVRTLLSLKLPQTIKSIYQIINDSWSDAVMFEKKELLYGQPFIEEQLDDFKFKIAIDSFFQVNPVAIKSLYAKIKKYANMNKQENVLDLFCGGGCIGIFLSRDAKFVWGVEISEAIIETARQNAKENNIENISFFAADARKFLNEQGTFYKNVDVLIVNPPRSGLSNKIMRAILRLAPKKIFYSSCNPETLFSNLKGLSGQYRPEFVEPFDFFPHTPHLETFVLLKR